MPRSRWLIALDALQGSRRLRRVVVASCVALGLAGVALAYMAIAHRSERIEAGNPEDVMPASGGGGEKMDLP